MRSFNLTLRTNLSEIVFFSAYGVFLFFSVLSTSLFYQYYNGTLNSLIMLASICMLVFGELFICSSYSRKQQIAIIIAVTAYVIVMRITGSIFATVGLLPFFVIASRKIDFNRIAFFSAIMMLFILLFVILSAKVGIVKNVAVVLLNGRRRAFLGFRFPLNPATITFNICSLWVYFRKDKIKLIEIFMLLCLDGYLFIKTDSKLCFVMTLCVIFAGFVLKYKYYSICNMKKLTSLLIFSFIIAFTISLVFALMYDDKSLFMRKLDKALEGRVHYAHRSLMEYGVTLFGEDIPWVGYGRDEAGNLTNVSLTNYFYVDNMYIQIMQHYGLVFFSAYMILHTGALYRSWKNEDLYAMVILSVIAFKCIIDNLSFYLYYNSFWFILSYVYLYNNRSLAENPAIKKLLRSVKLA
ncbi:MAG: hypothetical protein J5501_11145 [Ruminococcus sp.]|nr:hypothetical protein [Ruminococcus sp.]